MPSRIAIKSIPLFVVLSIVLHLFMPDTAIAQDVDLAWVKQMGGTGNDVANSTAVDAAGNVYVCGTFSATGDFDPGPGVFTLTSAGGNDIFITKLNPAGNFIWARAMGGSDFEVARSIAVDAAGNVFTTGQFGTTADFDPGAGVYNLVSAGQWDIFVSKLDANGNFVWAKQMGGTDYDLGWSISLDAAGNVYTTGEFNSSSIDFDPGPAVYNLNTFGFADSYIQKLDTNGEFLWVKQIGGESYDRSFFLTVDAGGNIYATGLFFSSNADFDPGSGSFLLSSFGSSDVFILKLDAAGNFVWAKQMGGTNMEQANALAVDNSGNVYTTGWFLGDGDYDPGSGIFTLSTAGSSGIFISKLNALGNFVWAKQLSGPNAGSRVNEGSSLVVDANQNIYLTGGFADIVDFDPGPGVFNLTSNGEWDIYLSIFNSSCDFISVKRSGGTGIDNALEITKDANDNIYVTGSFSGTVDFDPCAGTYNLTSNGQADIFIAKYAPPSVTIVAAATSICSGTPVTFTATAVNPGVSPTYQWKVNGTNVGTNSTTFTSNSLNNNDQVTVVFSPNPTCVPAINSSSNAITITVNASVIPAVSIATASTTICTGAAVTFTATPVNAGNNPVYQWQVNGINVGTNALTFTTNTITNNDVVKALLTNNSPCAIPNTAASNSILMQVNSTAAPSISILPSVNNICPGNPVTFTALPVNTGTTASYQWKLNNNNVAANNMIYTLNNPANGDKIYCIMTTVTSCSSSPEVYSNTVVMLVNPFPVISFNPASASISLGSSIQLNAIVTGNYASVLWTPATGLNNPAILNPIASPLTTTAYKLNVLGTNGCNSNKTIVVSVVNEIYIPNAFTPNGDGLNDIFRIPPGTALNLKYFAVYNRYGNLVFNTSNINTGWDGTYKGSSVPAGSYNYIIKGTDSKGEILIKGSIMLIR